jgi:hypothetical protein
MTGAASAQAGGTKADASSATAKGVLFMVCGKEVVGTPDCAGAGTHRTITKFTEPCNDISAKPRAASGVDSGTLRE